MDIVSKLLQGLGIKMGAAGDDRIADLLCAYNFDKSVYKEKTKGRIGRFGKRFDSRKT